MKNLLILLSAISIPAFAEVSDKIASIPELWLQGAIGGAVLYFLVRWSIWFGILALLVVAFLGAVSYETLQDPFVGGAVLREQGTQYVVASYGSATLMAVGVLLGATINYRRKHRDT
jgi:hypothetical protein